MTCYFFQIVFLLVLVFTAAQNGFCQSSESLSGRVAEIADRYAADGSFSGSVLLAKNGKLIYEKTFGFADRENKMPFVRETPSSIASVGKIFTSVLILKLAEERKLALSETISKFLPGAKIANAEKITIHQLLTHTSGLGNYMNHPDYADLKRREITLDDLLPLIASQPLVSETPGIRYEYSNSGYIVLGKIIESVTRKKYEDVLNEIIIKPLNLKNTRIKFNRENFQNAAKGYFRANASNEWQSTAAEMPTPSADGGIFTTAQYLYAFERALFGGTLLGRESLELMKKRHVEAMVPGLGKMLYGYGLMVIDYPNNAYSIGHNGGSPGYGTEYKHYFIGSDEFTLVIMSNYDRRIRPLLSEIQSELLKTPVKTGRG